MSVATYQIHLPPAPNKRGGDCRARDLTRGWNIYGPHRFPATTACRIGNGMIRATVGLTGVPTRLTIEALRGSVTVGDYLSDILSDTLGGGLSTRAWFSLGTLVLDSASEVGNLTRLQLFRISLERVTLRLVDSVLGDIYVTIRRGERMCRVQHGSVRNAHVSDRRIRWIDDAGITGHIDSHWTSQVEEVLPRVAGFPRFLISTEATTPSAGSFSLTATDSTVVRFGAGVGTFDDEDRPTDAHAQMADNSRPRQVVTLA